MLLLFIFNYYKYFVCIFSHKPQQLRALLVNTDFEVYFCVRMFATVSPYHSYLCIDLVGKPAIELGIKYHRAILNFSLYFPLSDQWKSLKKSLI